MKNHAGGVALARWQCRGPDRAGLGGVITELTSEQWLVSHHEERHQQEVRRVADRITALMQRHGPLFRGELRQPMTG